MAAIVSAAALSLGLAGCAGHSGPARADRAAPEFPALPSPALAEPTRADGDPVSAADVRALWDEAAAAAAQGQWTAWASVVDASTGEVLLDDGAATPRTPASVTKILTAYTALTHLDATATLTTGLSLSQTTAHLWGEGDLLLAAGAGDPDAVSGRAGLADLADLAARELRARGVESITLDWQPDPFDGDSRLPAWQAQDVLGYEGPVAALAIDAGRTSPGAYDFSQDPAGDAAAVLADALAERGIAATLGGPAEAPEGAEQIASVESATIGQQIRWMLHHSDNTVADQYCRLAARAVGAPASYAGATGALRSTLDAAGIDTAGLALDDCSGLSSDDRLTARTLVQTIRASMSDMGTDADELVRALPWAGLQGTMGRRMVEGPAAGNAQAKTGSLASVSSLAGVVSTSTGRLLIFAVGNDAVPDDAAALTRPHLDDFVEGLASL
ncbi:D-alanyl-D-alanine carboxypeptidase/D-alanyl-D-alanine-endopeptidase [Actinomyces sp. B33]|uniref:D-alanyl-D-alanine carboxypeptidase/D-alanyl-D-alanine endopeptidase n=1 Tax=Actinomyces sp. B33 TaxID=2942131 RepID=UPI0023419CC7|nr:D-alanyl-D-alanine carboxypeptidase/D-alanyl-D-alanine-endopeptidase [Actinomyces sp. B33]MDC4233514.1 D-alanyl-D-alanine carboxypeptidase/D-alanyl-D-alanine-endopeptidase [Actinomyces sp. B33]